MISRFMLALCLLFLYSCGDQRPLCEPQEEDPLAALSDSLAQKLKFPDDLKLTAFSGPDLTPSPACLAVAPTGEVYVGVDKIGSLGKEMNKGAIVRLVDCNQDGIIDSHTVFATLDNPRGIIAMGDQVFVLHTTFSEETEQATGMDLIVLEDKDGDGVADGPGKPLIQNISSAKFLRDRGTDHATNGIRMGIDGWIYIAVGDFGFHDAVDREGTKLTMLGGGIVRVRPDGTEMEVYTHGLRNTYDVAIDPYMNIFSRGNTNDGGGWNIRFSHQIQSGQYGYPMLFKHFTEEIIPALVDVGGGSGTGALYMDDDRWPDAYNRVPMMADWGRSYLYMHHVTPDKGSFTQEEEPFIQLPQITDLDVDAAGIMYLSAWDGAGYSGSESIGYTVRVVPEEFTPEPFPYLHNASVPTLVDYLKSGSSHARLNAQYELLRRPEGKVLRRVWGIVTDRNLSTDLRVAGLFTYSQVAKEKGIEKLVSLTGDPQMREFALRALADRKPWVDQVPVDPFIEALEHGTDRERNIAIIGLGRMGRKEAIPALLKIQVPDSFEAPAEGTEGPHATPNADIIPAHLAVQALVELDAVDECLEAVRKDHNPLALWALRYIHDERVPEALMEMYNEEEDEEFKNDLLANLARIYHQEAPYDGSWWWSTRPDTHGPYYKAIEWNASPLIRDFMVKVWRESSAEQKEYFKLLNSKFRMGIAEMGVLEEKEPIEDMPVADLEKIKNRKGQIGKTSIEDVMLALKNIKGDPVAGKKIFYDQGCQTCHSVEQGEVMKGPYMGQVGSIMNREQIAESILKPNASIAQGFSTVQIRTGDGQSYVGFVTEESADKLVIRNIAGMATTLDKEKITSREELETSMMPSGLANALSFEEFASLVDFLKKQTQ